MSRYIDISELEIPSDECSYEELETERSRIIREKFFVVENMQSGKE